MMAAGRHGRPGRASRTGGVLLLGTDDASGFLDVLLLLVLGVVAGSSCRFSSAPVRRAGSYEPISTVAFIPPA